jgi:hypothetical protein
MDAQSTKSHAEDIKRDIQASLEARRELGPAYDEQFLDALVERITREVAQVRQSRLPADNRFTAKQRSELAIVSLVFAIPLVAIAGGETGWVGILFVCAAIVAINLGAKWL